MVKIKSSIGKLKKKSLVPLVLSSVTIFQGIREHIIIITKLYATITPGVFWGSSRW